MEAQNPELLISPYLDPVQGSYNRYFKVENIRI